jgi:hypothetical protein
MNRTYHYLGSAVIAVAALAATTHDARAQEWRHRVGGDSRTIKHHVRTKGTHVAKRQSLLRKSALKTRPTRVHNTVRRSGRLWNGAKPRSGRVVRAPLPKTVQRFPRKAAGARRGWVAFRAKLANLFGNRDQKPSKGGQGNANKPRNN